MRDLFNQDFEGTIKASVEPFQISFQHYQNDENAKKVVSERSIANLTNEAHEHHELSQNSKRKLRQRIAWLLYHHTSKFNNISQRTAQLRNNTAFITLTLAAKQAHTDQEIKLKLLNQFLTELRKNYGKVRYVWKAEKQKNGNIHFHIVVNKYVSHVLVREMWNRIQDKLDYVKKYQLKGKGAMPPSTEVVGLRRVKNVYKYMVKYMCKGDEKHSIAGRAWGCSDELVKCSNISLKVDTPLIELLDNLAVGKDIYKFSNDYCTVYYLDTRDILETYFPNTFETFHHLAIEQLTGVYPTATPL